MYGNINTTRIRKTCARERELREPTMASNAYQSCRICCCSVSATHRVALFSRESLEARVAERLNKVIKVPVVQSDCVSNYMCRSCNKKFLMAESFMELAMTTYTKTRVSPDLELSRSNITQIQSTRKRSKETSGDGASPHTHQVRPITKRHTSGVCGRRLDFF